MLRLIDIPPAVQAARIRAAIGYSGKEHKEIANDLEISTATLRRKLNPGKPEGARSLDELHRIAELCGIPPQFMEEGFSRFEHDVDREQQLADLAQRLAQLTEQFEERTRRVDRHFETLEATLEERATTRVNEAIEQAQKPARGDSRRQATGSRAARGRRGDLP